MNDKDDLEGVEGTAAVAPEADLSTFALRWEEALGDEESDEAADSTPMAAELVPN